MILFIKKLKNNLKKSNHDKKLSAPLNPFSTKHPRNVIQPCHILTQRAFANIYYNEASESF